MLIFSDVLETNLNGKQINKYQEKHVNEYLIEDIS